MSIELLVKVADELQEGVENKSVIPINPTAIMDFFYQPGKTITDDDFHAFCEQGGYDVHQAEGVAYALAQRCMMFLKEGRSQGVDPNSFDPAQIDMGIGIESEHSSDPVIQKKITFDHLAEKPDYYSQECMQHHEEPVVKEAADKRMIKLLKRITDLTKRQAKRGSPTAKKNLANVERALQKKSSLSKEAFGSDKPTVSQGALRLIGAKTGKKTPGWIQKIKKMSTTGPTAPGPRRRPFGVL